MLYYVVLHSSPARRSLPSLTPLEFVCRYKCVGLSRRMVDEHHCSPVGGCSLCGIRCQLWGTSFLHRKRVCACNQPSGFPRPICWSSFTPRPTLKQVFFLDPPTHSPTALLDFYIDRMMSLPIHTVYLATWPLTLTRSLTLPQART